jgi:hypothetical protein
LTPLLRFAIPLFALFGSSSVPVPERTVHAPFPVSGVSPERVNVVEQMLVSFPADIGAEPPTSINTESILVHPSADVEASSVLV